MSILWCHTSPQSVSIKETEKARRGSLGGPGMDLLMRRLSHQATSSRVSTFSLLSRRLRSRRECVFMCLQLSGRSVTPPPGLMLRSEAR